jgi:hypothetical protein
LHVEFRRKQGALRRKRKEPIPLRERGEGGNNDEEDGREGEQDSDDDGIEVIDKLEESEVDNGTEAESDGMELVHEVIDITQSSDDEEL